MHLELPKRLIDFAINATQVGERIGAVDAVDVDAHIVLEIMPHLFDATETATGRDYVAGNASYSRYSGRSRLLLSLAVMNMAE